MGTVLNSVDELLTSSANNGPWPIFYIANVGNTTAANTTSGYVSAQRWPRTITQFSVGTGLTGAVFPYVRMLTEDGECSLICAIEYELGSLTVSSNSFSAGVSMPTKVIKGTSVTTASVIPMLVATAALTATTPVITITYTDQDGNGSQTCTMTLPTNAAVDTAFLMTPHLASADTGVRAVTNMSRSTGSAGTLKCYGLLPLSFGGTNGQYTTTTFNPITAGLPVFKVENAETLAFYCTGKTTGGDIIAVLSGIADN